MLKKETLNFFEEIEQNNNTPWFEENKPRCLAAQDDYLNFITELLPEIREVETIHETDLKKYVNRIYRDNRFPKEKIHYNNHIRISIERAADGKMSIPFAVFKPGNTFIAGGI